MKLVWLKRNEDFMESLNEKMKPIGKLNHHNHTHALSEMFK